MESTTARRDVLVVLGAITAGSGVPGCVTIGEDGSEETGMPTENHGENDDRDTETDRRDENTATGCADGCGTERLPEPSPLAEPLPGLVDAEDRAAFADEHGLEYRPGEVEVEIELEQNGERPDRYLSEVVDEFGRLVVAWVEIDVLVDLALDENVRRVQPSTDPEPDSPG